MPRKNKVKQYGLEHEVVRLKRKEGLSYKAIAKRLKQEHPELAKRNLPSHMSIKRYMDGRTEEEMEEAVEAGEAVQKIEEEFKGKMRELIGETEELKDRTNDLLNDAMDNDASYNDLVKIIKAQNKNLNQIRKNMISLMEYSDRKFLRPIEQIQEKKELHVTQIKSDVKDVLTRLSHKLCPKCRRIVGEELKEMVGE